jgi:hypothetical protein
MLNRLFLLLAFCGSTMIAFSQTQVLSRRLDPLKYFSLGDSIAKFIPFLKCADQGSANEIITIDRIPLCHGFTFSLESDSFLLDDIIFPSILLLTDSTNLVETISVVKTYLRTHEKYPKQNATKEFKKLRKYLVGRLSPDEENYIKLVSSDQKEVVFTKSDVKYVLRLKEIKQKRPVAAILDIMVSKM